MRPERGVARVHSSTDTPPVGLAFAVDKRWLLTCAHVVNRALRTRPDREATRPAGSQLLLVFPFGGGRGEHPVRSASVSVWLPADQDRFDFDDVVLLQLSEDIPRGVRVLRLAPSTSLGRVQMVGPVPGRPHHVHVTGELRGAVEDGRFQVDERLYGLLRVGHGFSGGPVWYRDTGRVAGMLQAAGVEESATDVYVLGLDALDRAYDPHRSRPSPDRRTWLMAALPDRWTWLMAVSFGVVGTIAAWTKVGWQWNAGAAGVAVTGLVFIAGSVDRVIARRRATRS